MENDPHPFDSAQDRPRPLPAGERKPGPTLNSASAQDPPGHEIAQPLTGDWEEAEVAEDEAEAPAPPRRSLPGWLVFGAFVVVLGITVLAAGRQFYNPESRIPQPAAYPLEVGLDGASEPVFNEVRAAQSLLGLDAGASPVALTFAGEVYEVELPRTLADRLFGKRRERATVFAASLPSGLQVRFLALEDGDAAPLFAIEAPSGLRRPANDVDATYIGLPAGDSGTSPFAGIVDRLNELLAEARAADVRRFTPDDYTVFGPFAGGDQDQLRDKVEGNVVLEHLTRQLDAAGAGVSLAAPVFSIRPAPERGVINATYQPRERLVQEPLGGDSDTSSLAHELTHAYISHVLAEEDSVLRSAVTYFERAHPRLYGEVVGDLYERLGSAGRAEETLAFLTGAIAAGETKTVGSSRLLQNQGLVDITEAVLMSDIDLLVRIGLLPDCMSPARNGRSEREVTFDYYRTARDACR